MINYILQYILKEFLKDGLIGYDCTCDKLIFYCLIKPSCSDCPLSDVTKIYTRYKPLSKDYISSISFCVYDTNLLTTKKILRYLLYMGVSIKRVDMRQFLKHTTIKDRYTKMNRI